MLVKYMYQITGVQCLHSLPYRKNSIYTYYLHHTSTYKKPYSLLIRSVRTYYFLLVFHKFNKKNFMRVKSRSTWNKDLRYLPFLYIYFMKVMFAHDTLNFKILYNLRWIGIFLLCIGVKGGKNKIRNLKYNPIYSLCILAAGND